jgi:RNA polymerase sigma factor (TIGR02999 family)
MSRDTDQAVQHVLGELKAGSSTAFDELFELVYAELRELAHHHRQRWEGNETLNTTSLVHEAYLKLVHHSDASWEARAHFMAAASRAIRHVLINYARNRKALKRGGELQRVELSAGDFPAVPGALSHDQDLETLIALDEALSRLADRSERQSRIVECRFFGGMTVKETAAALGVSAPTVVRGWALAQAWLYRELGRHRERPAG